MSEDELPKVSAIYDDIFGRDPFLIEEKNQLAFGTQIARNLLVERSIAASEPAQISLHAPKSRERFKEGLPKPTPLDDALLTQRYWEQRNNRTEFEPDDFHRLSDHSMLARGDLTKDRRGRRIKNNRDALDDLQGSDSPLSARLKFAAVGYRVPISRLHDAGVSEDLHPLPVIDADRDFDIGQLSRSAEKGSLNKLRRTALSHDANIEQWRGTIERHLKATLKSGSQFIVFPEFALPPDCQDWTAFERFKTIISEVERDPARLAKTPEFLLFSGTRHEGAFNRGLVFARGKDSAALPEAWWHYKVASARSLGENIMGPQSHKLPSYTLNLTAPSPPGTRGPVLPMRCGIYIAICYDVFDPTTFINYVIQCASRDENTYDALILVPSFNPGSDFHHALRDLSFVGNCPILYVNALHGDSKLFLFGFDILDLLSFEEKKASAGFDISKFSHLDEENRSGDSTKLDEYLCKQIKNKIDALNSAASVSKLLESGRDATDDNYIFLEMNELLNTNLSREQLLTKQIGILKEVHNKIREYRRIGVLSDMITQEGCQICREDGSHSMHDYCGSDILYYNIDPRLYLLLKKFRVTFFEDDDAFLPEPFRHGIRRRIRGKIEKRLRELDAKRRRYQASQA